MPKIIVLSFYRGGREGGREERKKGGREEGRKVKNKMKILLIRVEK